MNIRKLLSKDNIFLELQAHTKVGIIEEMIDGLVRCGLIKDKEAALKAVLDREAKMTTGMGNGIAIPHGKTDSVDKLITAIALKREGADFDAMDKQPAKIFIMTISPSSHSGPHIQFLAEVSRLLKDDSIRDEILEAKTKEDIIHIFS
jgi:PTS system nitrogen regulatory IIA component